MATGSRTRSRTTKAEQSRATRLKIVEAATVLFLRDGFVSTTMSDIAKQAGVAVQTLYLSFGNKTAILQAALDHALRGNPDDVDIGQQDWFAQVLADPDGAAALRLFCERSAEVIARAAGIFEVIRAASADPDVGEVLAENKRLRHEGYRRIMERVASRDGFASELGVDDAITILYTLLSEDGYLLMVTERGWTLERWLAWLVDICVHQLFPDRES